MTNSTTFSDEAIREFLLGRLRAAEQSRFEERLIVDNQLEERVRLAELQLADDYSRARLPHKDIEAFEERFLVTEPRKLRLAVSQTLHERFSTNQTQARERRVWPFSLNPRFARMAFAMAILIVLLGGGWLAIKEPRVKDKIKQIAGAVRRRPQRAPSETSHPERSAMPEHRESPGPVRDHEASPLSPAVVVPLGPDMTFENGRAPSIKLPSSENDFVRFQLAVDRTGPYRAELFTHDGQNVFAIQELKALDSEVGIVDLDVPSRVMKAGDYQIRLTATGEGEVRATSFFFRVQ